MHDSLDGEATGWAVTVGQAGDGLAAEELKRLLAERHSGDREAYTAAKAAFVANALASHAG